MGLSDSATAADLLAIFVDMRNNVMSDEEYSDRFAKVINDSIRRGQVIVPGVQSGSSTAMGEVT